MCVPPLLSWALTFLSTKSKTEAPTWMYGNFYLLSFFLKLFNIYIHWEILETRKKLGQHTHTLYLNIPALSAVSYRVWRRHINWTEESRGLGILERKDFMRWCWEILKGLMCHLEEVLSGQRLNTFIIHKDYISKEFLIQEIYWPTNSWDTK